MDDGLAAGTEVGGYRVVAPLGSGGMGTVYRALDGGGTAVALKLLHPHASADAAARDRLRREVAALQRLRHPGVAAVLDAEADSTEAFVVTELVDGLTLEEHVARGGPLPPGELAELARGLREALRAVHLAGVVHRDLKPGNVMLTPRGPVLIDFGIAQAADEVRMTSAGFVVGTPGYVAPELLGDADPSPATDWWGWAAVLVFAATGRPPFGTRLEAVLARTGAGEADLAGLDPAVAGPLRAALDPRPDRRAAPDDVVASLRAAAAHAAPTPPTQVVTRTTPGHPVAPGDLPAGDDTPTQVLVRDGYTRAVPVGGTASAVRAPDERRWDDDRDPAARHDDGGDDRPGDVDAALPPDDEGDGGDDDLGPEDETLPYRAPRVRRRAGTVLALGLLAVAAAMLYPAVTALAVAAALLVVRTVGSAAEAVEVRRERRGGAARGDVARTAAATPWHLLLAVLGLLPSVVVATAVVVVVGGLLWWALDTGRLLVAAAEPTPDGRNGPLAFAGTLGLVMVLALVAVWFGPLTRLTRAGARHVLRAVAPGWSGATVLVTAALAATGVLVVLLVTGQGISWWPLGGPPVPR